MADTLYEVSTASMKVVANLVTKGTKRGGEGEIVGQSEGGRKSKRRKSKAKRGGEKKGKILKSSNSFERRRKSETGKKD